MNGNAGDGGEGPTGGGEDLMRYDLLVEAALKHVVRMALHRVQHEGLPGEHHFYIAFDTRHDGVRMSDRLREQYPEEMTIVLQHQFWDLKVQQGGFQVGLAFGGVPEMLWVPFDAITGFYDPSVQFALQFRPLEEAEKGLLQRSTPSAAHDIAEGANGSASDDISGNGEKTAFTIEQARGEKKDVEGAGEEEKSPEKVVSLDAFRKKT